MSWVYFDSRASQRRRYSRSRKSGKRRRHALDFATSPRSNFLISQNLGQKYCLNDNIISGCNEFVWQQWCKFFLHLKTVGWMMFVVPSWWYWVIKSSFVWRPEWKACDRFGRMSWWKRRWKRTQILRQTRFLSQDRIPSTCHKSYLSINILIKNMKSFVPQLNKMYLWIQNIISSLAHN